MLFTIGYFVVFTCILYQVDGQFQIEPQDAIVFPDANATLHCTIDMNTYNLDEIDGYWTVGGIIFRPGWSNRYSILDPTESGKFDMHVLGANYSEDDKDYICAFHVLGTENKHFSSPAHLYVLNAPQSVTISKAPESELKEGDTVTLTCESLGGSPPPNITWYDPQGNAVPGTYNPGSNDVPSTNEISFQVSWTDHETYYTCEVWNQANINNVLSASEPLEVFHYPRVSLSPTNSNKAINVERGALEIITATVNAYPEVTNLVWNLDGLYVFGGFEYSLNPVKEEHAGTYVVEATNSEGTGSDELDVAVLYGPTITTAQYFTVVEGADLQITCEYSSNPDPAEVLWKNTEGSIVSQTAVLQINNIQRSQAGNYTCEATNYVDVLTDPGYRMGAGSTLVEVHYLPSQAKIDDVPAGLEFESLTLRCSADSLGIPVGEFEWEKEGTGIIHYGAEWTINSLTLQDNGIYKCSVRNLVGKGISDQTEVIVNKPPELTEVPENFIVRNESEQNFELRCVAKGKPEPSITWYTNGEIPSGGLFFIATEKIELDEYITQTTSTLKFLGDDRLPHSNSLMRDDSGEYQCQAVGAGSPASYIITLDVNFAPTPYGIEKFAAEVGSQGTVVCSTSTSPAPAFTWSRDGSQLTNDTARISIFDLPGEEVNVHESHLVIDVVAQDDYGLYNCLVVNNMGELEIVLTLQDTSAPDAPSSLTSYNLTDQSVELQWEEGFDGGLPSTYTVYYTNIKSGIKLDITGIVTSHYKLSGLTANTEYEIYVEAINDRGTSGPSNKILVTTEMPSVDVTKINLAPVTFSEVTKHLSWTSSSHDTRVCVRVNTKLEDGVWQHYGENCYDISQESVEINTYEKNMQMSVQACLTDGIDTDTRVCGAELIADIVFYIWMLIVIIVASILLVVFIIAIVFCCCYKKKPKEDKNSIATERDYEMENANARPKTFSNHAPYTYDNSGGNFDDVDNLYSNYNSSNNYYNKSIKPNGVLPPAYKDSSGSDIYKPDPWDADPYIIHVGDNDFYQNDHHNLHVSGLPDPYERDDYSSHSTGRAPSTTLTFVPNGGLGYDHNSITSGQSTPITPTRKIIHEVVV